MNKVAAKNKPDDSLHLILLTALENAVEMLRNSTESDGESACQWWHDEIDRLSAIVELAKSNEQKIVTR